MSGAYERGTSAFAHVHGIVHKMSEPKFGKDGKATFIAVTLSWQSSDQNQNWCTAQIIGQHADYLHRYCAKGVKLLVWGDLTTFRQKSGVSFVKVRTHGVQMITQQREINLRKKKNKLVDEGLCPFYPDYMNDE